MATRKVTVSIDDAALALAERAASAKGLSLSAWMSQAARREAVRTGYGPLAVTSSAGAAALEDAVADEAELTAAEEDLRAAG
jgi:hypothetical protein